MHNKQFKLLHCQNSSLLSGNEWGANCALTFEEKYNALVKDSPYDGVFVTGVVTTGIFCKPGCRARKPKAENVVSAEIIEITPARADPRLEFLLS